VDTKTIILILVVVGLVILVMNNNPRLTQTTLPTIGIIECECSDYYDISCMSWLTDPGRYNCVYEEENDLCGTCEKKLGSMSTPKQ